MEAGLSGGFGAFSRTELLLGEAAMERLARARIAVFGLGGVGGAAVEALARSGVGALELVDHDTVSLSNLNRQLIATLDSVGLPKTEAAARRIAAIHPDCRVTQRRCFFLPETEAAFDFTQYDYVVDAIDTVAGKLALVRCAQAAGTPIISALGTGNKLDPARLRVSDVYETSVCPLARVMRKEARKRGVKALKVVWSTEAPIRPNPDAEAALLAESRAGGSTRRDIPGSSAFVPAAAGLLIAAEIVKDLTEGLRRAAEEV